MTKTRLIKSMIEKLQAENNLLKVELEAKNDYIKILETVNKKVVKLAMGPE